MEGPGLSLQEAHWLPEPTGTAIQLAPGDPHAAHSRVANDIDLLFDYWSGC